MNAIYKNIESSFENSISVEDLALSIGPGLAKATVAGKIDGNLVDATDLIEKDSFINGVTRKEFFKRLNATKSMSGIV